MLQEKDAGQWVCEAAWVQLNKQGQRQTLPSDLAFITIDSLY